jgi:hypothetical protein
MMEPVDVTGKPVTRPRQWWSNLQGFLAWLSAREEFPGAGGGSTGPPRRSIVDVVRWLFATERLPFESPGPAQSAPNTGGLVRWCLSPDTLPGLPLEDADRRSIGFLARWLLAPEHLPIVETDTVGKGPGVVRWLLASEPLPPPIEDAATTRNLEA